MGHTVSSVTLHQYIQNGLCILKVDVWWIMVTKILFNYGHTIGHRLVVDNLHLIALGLNLWRLKLSRQTPITVKCQQRRRDDVYLVLALCKCLRYVDVSEGLGSLYDSTGPVHELGSSRFFYNALHLCERGEPSTPDQRLAVSGAHVMPVHGRLDSWDGVNTMSIIDEILGQS